MGIDVYAHRAGRGLAAENTLEACEICLNYEIDFIDFDIGLTRDGKLVVTHDPLLNVDITRGPDGCYISSAIPINQLDYESLSSYNVGAINPLSSYAAYFPQQRSFSFARIPLLEEAVALVQKMKPKVHFQIEMKIHPTESHLTHAPEIFAEALCAFLRESNLQSQTEVQSFNYRSLIALQKLDSSIKTTFLTDPYEGATSPSSWHHDANSNKFRSIPEMIHTLGGSCWGPFQMDLTQSSLEEAHQLGLKVVPWGYPEKEGTEFNECQIRKMIAWGIDGIITDRPDLYFELNRLGRV